MTRVYTLPFGVVPVLPASLAGLVELGDVCPDGLVRSVRVDRGRVGRVAISVQFDDDNTRVVVMVSLRAGPSLASGCVAGGWSLPDACALEIR